MAIVEKVDGFFIPNVTLIGVGAAKAIPERIVYLNATKQMCIRDSVHTGGGGQGRGHTHHQDGVVDGDARGDAPVDDGHFHFAGAVGDLSLIHISRRCAPAAPRR